MIPNSTAGPVMPTSTPPSAMPPIRPAELSTEPSASAEPSADGGTSAEPKRPSAGPSNELITPEASATAKISAWPPCAIRTRASSARTAWLAISSGRAGRRSASAPPQVPSTSTGSAWSMTTRPMVAAEPVSERISQFSPSTCIQVPAVDTRSAAAQSR